MLMGEGGTAGMKLIGLAVSALLIGLLLHELPSRVVVGLVLWVVGSLPLGVAVGHCVLNEE